MKLRTVGSLSYQVGYPDSIEASASTAVAQLQSSNGKRIIDFTHPDYDEAMQDMKLFREAWIGGRQFINTYLVQLSKRDDPLSMSEREQVTYCPAIAKAAVNEVKNAIFQRMGDVIRKGGPKSYQDAVNGDKWGVDKLGSSMNVFVNNQVLPELLAMGKVGVYIDRPYFDDNATLKDTVSKRQYLYIFKREDILAWVPDESSEPNQFSKLLLRENHLDVDVVTGLPICWNKRYRFLSKENGQIAVRLYDNRGAQIDSNGLPSTAPFIIKLPVMPFVLFEISESLLTDIGMYQVCLMNLASSDMSYALKANFPFYTEQYDEAQEPGFYKTTQEPNLGSYKDAANINFNQNSGLNDVAKEEIEAGPMRGRRYPLKAERPGFINPSSEPLLASMKKQEQLKLEIRQILSLWLQNVTSSSVPTTEQTPEQSQANGLNNIGLEIEHGERNILMIWAMYEGSNDAGTVSYPTNYSVKSDGERRKEAKEINELKSAIPSYIYQKETAKQSAYALFNGKIPQDKLQAIFDQIDNAKTMTCNAEEIKSDSELGLVGLDLASQARGYPPGEVAKAKVERAERLALIQAAQTAPGQPTQNPAARGIADMSTDPSLAARSEKQASVSDSIKDPTVRGTGK